MDGWEVPVCELSLIDTIQSVSQPVCAGTKYQ